MIVSDIQTLNEIISNEMKTLMSRLIKNDQIRIAGHVMIAYLIRLYDIPEDKARRLMIYWVKTHFPIEYISHHKRLSLKYVYNLHSE